MAGKSAAIPEDARRTFEAIASLVDAFCREHLNEEYGALCRRLTEKLARKRPSPLLRGKPQTWACGIVRTIGWVNFLDDPSQKPHMKLTAIDKAFGVGESTGQGKSMLIRKMLKISPMDPAWTLPSRMDRNPAAWMIMVNGIIVDVRYMGPEIQEEAFRLGLIPYIPGPRSADPDTNEPPVIHITEASPGKAPSTPELDFTGTWHIVSMSAWDNDYVNEEVQAYIEFGDQGCGSFQFGYVQGQMDYRTATRNCKPAVEFSWEGGDGADGTPLTGHGWATLEGDELNGLISIFMGDESKFVAKRPPEKTAT